MSGRRYQVIMAPAAHRLFKGFDPHLRERVKKEVKRLAEAPYDHEELKGPLKGLHSYKFSFKGTPYRIAYRVNEEKQLIEVVLVQSRQNFYERLK